MTLLRWFVCFSAAVVLAGCASAEQEEGGGGSAVVVAKSKTAVERPIMLLDLEASKTVCVSTCKAVDIGTPDVDGKYPESGTSDAFTKLVDACVPTGSVTVERAKKLLKDNFNADAEHLADESLWTSKSESDDVYGDWLALVEGSSPCKSKLADMLSTREELLNRVAALEAELTQYRAKAQANESAQADQAAQARRQAELDRLRAEREAAERERQRELRAYRARQSQWFPGRYTEGGKDAKGKGDGK
jgi:hypothetical protein